MDENDKIDGGGPDQVPVINDPVELNVGSPRDDFEQPESPPIEEDGYRSGQDEAVDEYEDYGDFAIDLSGNNPHRVSPGPSETSSRPGRPSSVIPPVRTRCNMHKIVHFNFKTALPNYGFNTRTFGVLSRPQGSQRSTSRRRRCYRR
jgi:hypothetical protein